MKNLVNFFGFIYPLTWGVGYIIRATNLNRFKVINKLMISQLILLKLRDTSDDQIIVIANIVPIYTSRLLNKTI